MIDYYQVLGLDTTASEAEIKKAYRDLALSFHPDKNSEQNAQAQFQLISEAYTILSNSKTRNTFDQERELNTSTIATTTTKTKPAVFSNRKNKKTVQKKLRRPVSLPSWFRLPNSEKRRTVSSYKQRQRTSGRQNSRRWWNSKPISQNAQLQPEPISGGDLHRNIELTIQEIANGLKKTIPIIYDDICLNCVGSGSQKQTAPRRCNRCDGLGTIPNLKGNYEVKESCPSCQGKGTVVDHLCHQCFGKGTVEQKRQIAININAGIQEGTILKIAHHGKSGLHGGENGNLYLTIHQKIDERFSRQGDDLTCQIELDFTEAILGARVKINTLDDTLELMVPPGVQHGQTLPVPSHGLPKSNGKEGKGDLLVKIQVRLPNELTHRQKKLLVQFHEPANAPIKID